MDDVRGFRITLPLKLDEVPRPFAKRSLEALEALSNKRRLKEASLKLDDLKAVPENLESHRVDAGHECPCKASEGHQEQSDDKSRFGDAVKDALKMYQDVWTCFVTSRYWHGEDKASELAELQVTERYEEACSLAVELLPWVKSQSYKQMGDARRSYTTVHFQGSSNGKRCGLFRNLEHLRTGSMQGCALDALCALMAVLSSRQEKSWLDGTHVEVSIKENLKWVRNKEDKLREELLTFMSRKVWGQFARKLVDDEATFRLAFANDEPRLRPASLMVTYTVPLQDALEEMDSEGPLEDRPDRWFHKSSRQFALQDICLGNLVGDRNERAPASTLAPEPKIKELFSSRKPVVFLDAIASLAPRKFAKEYNLSKIVQWELAGLLQRAKDNGQAVVFMLGGGEPHILAEKVYLRPPFTDNGLRCGYLRWRESPQHSWAREKLQWGDRTCIGLQLP